MDIKEYINNNWKNTVRTTPEDSDTLISMPYPYTVPSISGMFQEMYYWDTYFTNKGLIISGMVSQAKNNTDNMLYLVKKFGYMPNGNHRGLLNRSQPPFLSLMVRDVYDCIKDKEWLIRAYESLCIEYHFWISKRGTITGLNQYKGNIEHCNYKPYADMYKSRTEQELKACSDKMLYRHCLAVCESGWDITQRWGTEAYDFIEPDLNCLLYAFEKNMEYFSFELGIEDKNQWSELKNNRISLMRRYLCDELIYKDYNMRTRTHSEIISAASLFPLFTECASNEEAEAVVDRILPMLERKYGLSATAEKSEQGTYQWSSPNSWAPLTFVAIKGLMNYGFTDDAYRLAEKYRKTTKSLYERTGNMWEKYNAETGNLDVVDEYGTPHMLGWSAGVYLLCDELLKN